MACILFSVSAVNVQDSQAYRNMDMTRERISLIFELSAIFLSFQMVLSLASAAVAWAILARISGLDPSSVMIAPRLIMWVPSEGISCVYPEVYCYWYCFDRCAMYCVEAICG